MKKSTENTIKLIKQALKLIPERADLACPCQSSLELAIWTDRAVIAPADIRELEPLIGRYLGFVTKKV